MYLQADLFFIFRSEAVVRVCICLQKQKRNANEAVDANSMCKILRHRLPNGAPFAMDITLL